MTRAVPVARVQRLQNIQARASRLASAAGAHNGAIAAVAAEPDNEGKTSAELWLYGVVGGYWWGFNDKSVGDQLRGLNVDHITVRLNSPGGDVIQGIAIGNLLRNHKASVTVVVDGIAASAASIIAIAGDEVVMSPGSQFMIHDPWFMTMGNAKELRHDADFLDKQGANMASVYALRTGETAEAMRDAMTAEPDGTWYSAEEAVEAKLADSVGTVVAVSAAPEPPDVDLDDEDDDITARAAWDLEVLISPTARAAWSYKPPAASAPGSVTTPEGEPAMAFTPEQLTQMRKDLGLQADADEATIVAALSEAANSAEITPPTTPQIPEGMSLVDSAVLTQLQQGAEAGRSAAATLAEQERDNAFKDALSAGKITADTAKTLRAKVEENPDTWVSTQALLDALTPGLVPTAEVGHEGEPQALGAGIELDDAEIDTFAASLGLNKEALRG
ncbi:head maturation protease, ClpP-related [Nocardioides sp. SR21]|uniref:head maturation protease, ClpP-related n=1 Tax=Nocardioides sp. SR21 TaxID=2919501 RepID=UPI001FAAA773|nr:head maturation protease, ClpP-related [Nocardioides sp. SR21]